MAIRLSRSRPTLPTVATRLLQNLLLVALVQKPSNKHTFNQWKVFAPKQTTTDSIVTLVFWYFAKARRTSTARTTGSHLHGSHLHGSHWLAPPQLAPLVLPWIASPRLAPLVYYHGSHLHGSHLQYYHGSHWLAPLLRLAPILLHLYSLCSCRGCALKSQGNFNARFN